ncbi:MAG: hypothetical protein II943_07045 [Victivallales bacterium]|nr:hypothetical protein [Victivallales bacterium]
MLAAGIGGFLIGGPLGAAAAAGAVGGYEKKQENEKQAAAANRDAQINKESHEKIQEHHQRRLAAQKKREEQEKRQLVELDAQYKADIKLTSERAAQAAAQRDQLLIATLAIGIAAGTVDGALSSDESGELHDLLDSLRGDQQFSPAVQAKMHEFEAKPPTFMKAKKEVDKVQNADLSFFRRLIICITRSDNETSPEEVDFLEKWDTFYPATKKQTSK